MGLSDQKELMRHPIIIGMHLSTKNRINHFEVKNGLLVP